MCATIHPTTGPLVHTFRTRRRLNNMLGPANVFKIISVVVCVRPPFYLANPTHAAASGTGHPIIMFSILKLHFNPISGKSKGHLVVMGTICRVIKTGFVQLRLKSHVAASLASNPHTWVVDGAGEHQRQQLGRQQQKTSPLSVYETTIDRIWLHIKLAQRLGTEPQ